jgi:hypothetical protein
MEVYYAQSTLHSHRGHAHCRLNRRRHRRSEDIRSQKPLLFRPRQWSRDSGPCEHEKLSDGTVAPVIYYLTFS